MANARKRKSDHPKEGAKKSGNDARNRTGPSAARKSDPGAPPGQKFRRVLHILLDVALEGAKDLTQQGLVLKDGKKLRANPQVRGLVQIVTALRHYRKELSQEHDELEGLLDPQVAQWTDSD